MRVVLSSIRHSSLCTSSPDGPALAPADEQLFLLRLRLALDDESRDGVVRRFGGQAAEADAVVVLLELNRPARGEQARRVDLRAQAGEGQLVAARPEVDVEVESVAAAREAAVARAARLADVGLVDRDAVLVHPAPDGGEYGDRLRGD